MRLFVGYGYNSRDQWVEELVFPLLNALGCEVVHGKVMYGDSLAPEIKDTVLACDALIGFTTRREQIGDRWTTHRWVIEELAVALKSVPVVEVREDGIDAQLGMLGTNQHIRYDEAHRDKCLVEIAQAICRIRESVSQTTFRLEPPEFATHFRRVLNKPGLQCSYRVMRRNVESEFRVTRMWRLQEDLRCLSRRCVPVILFRCVPRTASTLGVRITSRSTRYNTNNSVSGGLMVNCLSERSEYIGDGLWRWSVFLPPDAPFRDIQEVIYTLHPTFNRPVRKVLSRENGFLVQDITSCPFTVYARLVFTDGVEQLLEKHLDLTPRSPSLSILARHRFIRTLKEQLLRAKIFRNVEELRCALAEFRELYNQRWIVQRLDYLTPAQARQQLLALGAAA